MALKVDMKNVPPYVKVIVAVVPSVVIIALFIFLLFNPKNKEIKRLNTSITQLENEIASSEVKLRRLDELKVENERLRRRLARLKQQLPEEKEVSILLKQVSDLGIESGLEILLWKPGTRRPDPSGLYVEIPVSVEVVGGYHDLGSFYSEISRIDRIVNVSGINISSGAVAAEQDSRMIKAAFTASTFSAVEAEPEY